MGALITVLGAISAFACVVWLLVGAVRHKSKSAPVAVMFTCLSIMCMGLMTTPGYDLLFAMSVAAASFMIAAAVMFIIGMFRVERPRRRKTNSNLNNAATVRVEIRQDNTGDTYDDGLPDKLEKLKQLAESGALSAEEYSRVKAKLLE